MVTIASRAAITVAMTRLSRSPNPLGLMLSPGTLGRGGGQGWAIDSPTRQLRVFRALHVIGEIGLQDEVVMREVTCDHGPGRRQMLREVSRADLRFAEVP